MEKRAFFEEVLNIRNESLLQKLVEISILQDFKKGGYLVREDSIPAQLLFLIKGVCRGFFYDHNGKEVTDCFGYRCGDAMVGGFGLEKPSEISIAAETPVRCLVVPMVEIVELIRSYPELMYVYNSILSENLERHVRMKRAIYKNSAKEKYRWFLETYPGLIDVVKHRHVASFLNMTPESLSRVRKEVRREERESGKE